MTTIKVEAGPYRIYDDGEGHRYLIPEKEYSEFDLKVEELENYEGDDVFSKWEELLEPYYRLEGESYLVILDSEVKSIV